MSSSKAYLTWALNQEGDLVYVDEVPNGNECGCVCPHCFYIVHPLHTCSKKNVKKGRIST